MADQVAITLPKSRVPEATTFPATAYFRTRSTKAADTPTTVHYRVDCLSTGKELQTWTSVSAASSVAITITATHNAIQSDTSRRERKQLIVQADRGLSTQATGSTVWLVENLKGIL